MRNYIDDVVCFCIHFETRIEDFTLRTRGQELTRKIELEVCVDCRERRIPGRIVSEMLAEIKAKKISSAIPDQEYKTDSNK